MIKIQSGKARGAMETCVNFAHISFFVTVLEKAKKLWFVAVVVSCWVFVQLTVYAVQLSFYAHCNTRLDYHFSFFK